MLVQEEVDLLVQFGLSRELIIVSRWCRFEYQNSGCESEAKRDNRGTLRDFALVGLHKLPGMGVIITSGHKKECFVIVYFRLLIC